ncbi:pentapeptide repeat-containing protein [Streptomyces sp. NPDC093568]|uniref:pentapeptide repeat-containing protein n=1 Tax=Streptomyces sp. NPDC093568 TaxID=3366041 RepID=UPI00381123F4
MFTLSEPTWPRCGRADLVTGLGDCGGIHVPGHTACLAHLSTTERSAYLAALNPGDNVDHRGTPFTEALISLLLNALRDPDTEEPHFGTANFSRARFADEADFGEARFAGAAWFVGAQFSDEANFGAARFSREAMFGNAEFSQGGWFHFAEFSDEANFHGARFSDHASFHRAQFADRAEFATAVFLDEADFGEARFTAAPELGPLVCADAVDLSGALFETPVSIQIAAPSLVCERTRWEATATLRLRYSVVDLSHAVLSTPMAITAHPTPFTYGRTSLAEEPLAGQWSGVVMHSVQGVDAAHLVLTDTDLSFCLFSGAFHLDQLRLEGRCAFAATPTGLHLRHGVWPYRWTRRRALAEEHHWRAQTAGQPAPPPGHSSRRLWHTGRHHPTVELTPDPEDVAVIYRQLRKAFEDGKNEPGAADFYYGEMEMRRHDRSSTPPGERGLLWCYWLLSGYGLRASRAVAWLLAAMAATVLLVMGLGLPDSAPRQTATGAVPAGGGRVTLTLDKPDPRLTLPVGERFTTERFDKAFQVVLNSVVFRSSGQDLTTWGTYTEMICRFTEPALLALAVLAMRNRIKR